MHPDPTLIPSQPSESAPVWQREWPTSFRKPLELLEFLGLDINEAPEPLELNPSFPFLVPRDYAARMHKSDWSDPLLRQVLPLHSENASPAGFVSDAVGDLAAQNKPGLLCKYHGRALLLLSGACAVHCRCCFRREFPFADLPAHRAEWEQIYAGLAPDKDLKEIIFSGGDPLSLSEANLRWHWERALVIPQVRRIRIHTRLPVAIPSRINPGFLELAETMAALKPLFIVLHVNHANEINAELKVRLQALLSTGAVLLNQAVLLRGVNDNVGALVSLSERLLDCGVLPYYLHQLDRVRGAQHFEVPEEKGLALMEELRRRLPGYGVPKYVREVAGETSKVEIAAAP